MTTVRELQGKILDGAKAMAQMSGDGALHIFVEDGNCGDEDLEFCLDQPDITESERKFANVMRNEFSEEERCAVYAFAQCSDIEAALAPPPKI